MTDTTPARATIAAARPVLTVVVPVYNEQEGLRAFHERLSRVLAETVDSHEILYVNDGSRDGSLAILRSFCVQDSSVALVDLSRNFGKEIAMTAGMDHSHGQAVVIIDADMQDPPELIPELVAQWRAGYDNVFARRRHRGGETWLKKATSIWFYKVIGGLSRVEIPRNTGDFRLLSRRAVDSLALLREQHRFMKGLFAWIGYPSVAVEYDRDPRHAGESKFNYWKLWNFALEGITSFTIAPLKLATYLGGIVALIALAAILVIIGKTVIYGEPVHGYASLMCTVLFLGGVQLVAVGCLGEYIGRMFNETKNRPLYLVNNYVSASAPGNADAPR